MYIEILIIMVKKWKQPKCRLNNEKINKMWHIHVMEYYLAMKMNGVMINATAEKDLHNIIPHERSQIRRATYYMIPIQ